DDRRRHHRPERRPPGQAVRRGRRGDRDHPHQARRDREGRDRARDRPRAGHPGQADRHRRAARRPAPVRRRRLRAGVADCVTRVGRADTIGSSMDSWAYWLIAAVILAIGEIATTGLFLAPFAAGALVATLLAAAGAGAVIEWAVFLVVSVILLAALRPLAPDPPPTPPNLP